jgi:dipeptidyl aminopeptidase/acylaminoacyl peptidase
MKTDGRIGIFDRLCNLEQSQVMYGALQRAEKDVQLVTVQEGDYWLSRGATRLPMLEASIAFLRAHNPPDP